MRTPASCVSWLALDASSKYGGFPKLGVPTIMENQMEKKMENEMETGFL